MGLRPLDRWRVPGCALLLLCAALLSACVPKAAPGTATAQKLPPDVALVQDAVKPLEVLFHQNFVPPYVARTQLLPPRGSINYERRGLSPLKYRLVLKRDIMLREGTIKATLVRRPIPEVAPQQGEWDTVFAFADAFGDAIMSLHTIWGLEWGGPGIYSDGIIVEPSKDMSSSVWGYWIPFPKQIKVGETYSVSISWGEMGNRVFLNDQLLTGYVDLQNRKPADRAAEPFVRSLGKARLLIIGNDLYNGDNSPLDSNEIHSLTIYAEQM